ncbi:hypothetical protein BGZ82_009417, partial [Podila clonocystis]
VPHGTCEYSDTVVDVGNIFQNHDPYGTVPVSRRSWFFIFLIFLVLRSLIRSADSEESPGYFSIPLQQN